MHGVARLHMFGHKRCPMHEYQVASTRMACADPARGATEAQFISVLQGTTSYRLAGPGRLVLLDASGRTVAALSTSGR